MQILLTSLVSLQMDASGMVHEDDDSPDKQKKPSRAKKHLKKFSRLFTGGDGDIGHEPLENSYDDGDDDDGYGTIGDSSKGILVFNI